jgi:acyl-CoA thioesterase
VVAEQESSAIFSLAASFTRGETGIEHQEPAPEAPGPDGLPDWEDLRAQVRGDPGAIRRPGAPTAPSRSAPVTPRIRATPRRRSRPASGSGCDRAERSPRTR